MLTAAAAFACALLASIMLTPVVRNGARRLGLFDHALSARKVHGKPIPRVGGVAIVIATAGPFVAGILRADGPFLAAPALERNRILGLLLAGAVVVLLGMWDDVRGADAKVKFAVQFTAAAVLYVAGVRIDALSLPLLGALSMGWLALPLTMLWVAGVINAVNLIDGLDGLAAGLALVASAALCGLAVFRGDAVGALLAASVAGAVLGFLAFNRHPASIFMGDTGSMFLGFVLAAAPLHPAPGSATPVPILVPIVLLGIPIADTLLSIGRRFLRGVPLFAADRGHVHHRLLARGLSHSEAVTVLHASAVVLAVAALTLFGARDLVALVVLGGVVLAAALALRWLGYLDPSSVRELARERRRNVEMRLGIERLATRLSAADEPVMLWQTVREAAPVLLADHVALRIAANGEHLTYGAPLPPANESVVRATFQIPRGAPGAALLELAWTDGRCSVGRDTELVVERLCDHLSSALSRIDGRRAVGKQAAPVRPAVVGVVRAIQRPVRRDR